MHRAVFGIRPLQWATVSLTVFSEFDPSFKGRCWTRSISSPCCLQIILQTCVMSALAGWSQGAAKLSTPFTKVPPSEAGLSLVAAKCECFLCAGLRKSLNGKVWKNDGCAVTISFAPSERSWTEHTAVCPQTTRDPPTRKNESHDYSFSKLFTLTCNFIRWNCVLFCFDPNST